MNASSRSCAMNRELISAFVDGELAVDERAQLANHLATCAECRAVLDSYRAIGGSIRSLPAAHPPDDLTDAIYAQTIDVEPRRLLFLTSRLGYSVAAIAAVALIVIVAGYLLVGGYQRGVTPTVASSSPEQGAVWPTYKPIEITFNKPMDHDSVIKSLAIQPSVNDERLNMTWDGNTLVIGADAGLKADSSYAIRITTGARDKWGHRLETDFTLQFSTQPTVAISDTPTPVPTEPVATPTPTVGATAVPPTATAPNPVVNATPTAGPPAPTATATNPNPPTATPDSGAGASGGNPPPPTPTLDDSTLQTPTPTAVPDTPTPAPTPTTSPAAPAAPTATLVAPTATAAVPTPTSTSQPTPTSTPNAIPVTGSFGDYYWGNDYIRDRLGDPLSAAVSVANQSQDFQHGTMYLRGDTNEIYTLVTGSNWSSFPNIATTDPEPEPGPEAETWVPGGVLGVLWRNESSVSEPLGYALEEQATSFTGLVQEFNGGVMLSGGGEIYVLYYSDLTWEFYPDTGSADSTQ